MLLPKNKNAPKASAIPLTNPVTTPTTPNSNHPPAAVAPPSELDEETAELALLFHAQLRPAVPLRRGAIQPQKPIAMSVPVTVAAVNPARDFRGASGRPRKGRREGRRGDLAPNKRPMVDAAVSAHERLMEGMKLVRFNTPRCGEDTHENGDSGNVGRVKC